MYFAQKKKKKGHLHIMSPLTDINNQNGKEKKSSKGVS